MVKLEHVTFGYVPGKSIIDNFSFEFEENKTYTICGENGKGKTTLIKLILGLLKPEEGMVERKNVSVVGYVPDYNGLYDGLTIKDNIFFRLGIYNKKVQAVEDKLQEWSKKYALQKYMDTPVKELSLGTQKKAALLCTLLTEPDVLVLDEPTGGLDKKAKEELVEILKIYQDKMTIITVTHDEFYRNALEGQCITI